MEPVERKLGRRPPIPGRPALRLAPLLTGKIPEHPMLVDYLGVLEFGLYRNDEFGDCGPVSVANCRRLVTSALAGFMEMPSQEAVFDLYRRSGNPRFNPETGADDNGVIMQLMLEELTRGGIGGVKPVAFAKVDVDNPAALRAAVAIFGYLLAGVTLEWAQNEQTDLGQWDYRPGSGVWGGHAVLAGEYMPGRIGVVTWGRTVGMTDLFVEQQLEEAWVVIWPEHLSNRAFLEGVDRETLVTDYRELTGRPLYLDPEPPPPPPLGCFPTFIRKILGGR